MAEAQYNGEGIVRFATGTIDPTATGSKVITLGWTPRHIRVFNEDLVIMHEKFGDMAATSTVKTVTAGTTTLDTDSDITIDADAGAFTIGTDTYGDGDRIHWAAWG